MDTKLMRVSENLYNIVGKLAKEKDINYTEALELLVAEKQDIPAPKKEEVFDLGILKEQHFIYQEFLSSKEEYVCAVCMDKARKKYPFLLTHERTKHCYLRGRKEVENHFKEKHPEVLETLKNLKK